MDQTDEMPSGPGQRKDVGAPRRSLSRLAQVQVLVAASLLGVVSAVGGVMAWTALSHRGQLPPLKLEEFARARRLWNATAPPNYDITIEVAGRQAAVYHVEVRDGEVVVSTRDSRPLKQMRTRGTWSVPGMFNTIQSDVDNAERHRLGTAAAGVPQVRLCASLDPKFGFPQRYHRTELRKWGNNDVVSWRVTEFAVVSRENSARPAESSKSDSGALK